MRMAEPRRFGLRRDRPLAFRQGVLERAGLVHSLNHDADALCRLVGRGGDQKSERRRRAWGQAEILAGEDGLLGLAERPSAAIQQFDGDAQFSVAVVAGRDAVAGAPIGQREGHLHWPALHARDGRPADFHGARRDDRAPDRKRVVVNGPLGMDVGQDMALRQPLAASRHVALRAGVLVRGRRRQILRRVFFRLQLVTDAAEVGAGQSDRVLDDGMRADPAFIGAGISLAQLVTRAALDAELALAVAKFGRLSRRLFQQRSRGMVSRV